MSFYKIKKEHGGTEYPWPCRPYPDRTYVILDCDILTKAKNGKYTKHNGLGTFNHVIPDEHLDEYTGWPRMSLAGNKYGKYEEPKLKEQQQLGADK